MTKAEVVCGMQWHIISSSPDPPPPKAFKVNGVRQISSSHLVISEDTDVALRQTFILPVSPRCYKHFQLTLNMQMTLLNLMLFFWPQFAAVIFFF